MLLIMDTVLRNFEVSIPEEFTDTLKAFVKALKGSIKAEKKCALDKALEDIEAGRIQNYPDFESFKKEMLEL